MLFSKCGEQGGQCACEEFIYGAGQCNWTVIGDYGGVVLLVKQDGGTMSPLFGYGILMVPLQKEQEHHIMEVVGQGYQDVIWNFTWAQGLSIGKVFEACVICDMLNNWVKVA